MQIKIALTLSRFLNFCNPYALNNVKRNLKRASRQFITAGILFSSFYCYYGCYR